MLGSKVREHLSHIAKVDIALTTLGAFLRTVRDGVVSRLAPDDMTCVGGEGGVLIRVSQEMIRKRFEMGMYSVMCRMHRKPIFALLVIGRLAEVA